MNIVVCIKQVPASNKVKIDPETGVLIRDGVDAKINPYDLYAIEAALRLKEKYAGEVCVVSMGPMYAQEAIREAYAMGADKGFLITDPHFIGSDVLATSHAIAQALKLVGDLDLILCGKQTTDGDTAQVGHEIGEKLEIPSISNVLAIKHICKKQLVVDVDLGDRLAVIQVALPCLLMVDKNICQPRLPSYIRKMETKNKEVSILTLGDMEDRDELNYGLDGSPTNVQRIFTPDNKGSHELWTGSCPTLSKRMAEKLQQLKFI